MALTSSQQIFETIKRSQHPLICLPSGAGADHYATAIGWQQVLKKMGTSCTTVAADGTTPKQLHFLSGHADIKPHLDHLRRFVIELDASKTKVDELTYEMKGETLRVYLSPKNGFWDAKDVRTLSSAYLHDLIICIGSPDYESCAHLFSENTDFFFRTPVLNIDHSPENAHYGQINMVDLTASACSEVSFDVIDAFEPELIDEQVATAFLTGMIAKTKRFQTSTITPKTLQTASKLVAKGANREQIIQHLYRTRSVSTLRLWGRALARLKIDATIPMVWTLLSQQDFLHAGAHEQDLPDVIDELLSSSHEAKIIVLIYENAKRDVCAIVRTERPMDALFLCAPFHAQGTHEEVRLVFPQKTIVQVEQSLLETFKQMQKK